MGPGIKLQREHPGGDLYEADKERAIAEWNRRPEPAEPAPVRVPDALPMQPIVMVDGVARFKANAAVRWMANKVDLNSVAAQGFSNEDMAQLMQLIGYSVSGFGGLDYADQAVVAIADARVEMLTVPHPPAAAEPRTYR